MPLYRVDATGSGPVLASGLYTGWGGAAANSAATAAGDGINCFLRFPVSRACTLDRIGIEITTAGAASVTRLGIYADAGGKPGALILDAGTVNSTGTGYLEITISQAIGPGVIWLCACAQGSASVAWRYAEGGDTGGGVNSSGLNMSQFGRSFFYEGTVTGALPATATPIIGSGANRPRVIVRVA